ncbi:hypothetical protein ACEQ8H_000836 [Pleosporales sp. CAS-2024a]
MSSRGDELFLLFFRIAYLSMMLGFVAFTCLGFARLGTVIGLVATIIVASGSEIMFLYNRWEHEKASKVERHMV